MKMILRVRNTSNNLPRRFVIVMELGGAITMLNSPINVIGCEKKGTIELSNHILVIIGIRSRNTKLPQNLLLYESLKAGAKHI